jgi:hypothetical protein
MQLSDVDNLDPNYSEIVVLFNASQDSRTFTDYGFIGHEFLLHPILQNSVDPVVQTSTYDSANGSFRVPGRTTAVFILDNPVPATQEPSLLMTATPLSVIANLKGISPLVVIGIVCTILIGGLLVVFLLRKRNG